jgi:hypothetical protein
MQREAALLAETRASGWYKLTKTQISDSTAQYWVFVLLGFANRTTDFVIIDPQTLLKRLRAIHGENPIYHCYFLVTNARRCFETRGLNRADRNGIAENKFDNAERNFSEFLNVWKPMEQLRGPSAQ